MGMTVDELARAFGLSPQLLMDFEAGRSEWREAERYRPILEWLERERGAQRDEP